VTLSFSPGRKILIVEDEMIVAMELGMILEDEGYQVLGPVGSVGDALAIVGRVSLDGCILDLNLRGENSAPVAQALKDHGVPFILSTAYRSGTLDQHPAFEAVINVGKPVAPKTLLEVLSTLLDSD
jgi:DNA-binding response OmpR family regulator